MKLSYIALVLFLGAVATSCSDYADEDGGGKKPDPVPPSVGKPTPEKPKPKPETPKPEVEPPVPAPEPPKQPEARLSAEVRAFPEPNRYQVALSWKIEPRPSLSYIQRNGGKDGLLRIETNGASEGQLGDTAVVANTDYEYVLCVERNGRTETVDRKTVHVPLDLVVTKAEDFSGAGPETELNRVFFTDKAIITLSERGGLTLYAKELISDNAVLQSHYRGQKSQNGTHGYDGGPISLHVSRARGTLTIESRGEHGGDGNEGVNGQAGGIGSAGTPGEWTTHPEWHKYSTSAPQYYIDTSNKYYLNREFDFWWSQKLSGNQPAFVCKTPPTDGGPGGDGQDGQDGQDGGKGGDTARVFIDVKEPSELAVEMMEEPGLGGLGGRGGKGGAGGAGGPPGALDAGHRCPPAKQGPSGKAGENGRQGRPGANGSKQPYCIKIGDKARGDCKQFVEDK